MGWPVAQLVKQAPPPYAEATGSIPLCSPLLHAITSHSPLFPVHSPAVLTIFIFHSSILKLFTLFQPLSRIIYLFNYLSNVHSYCDKYLA